MFSKKPSYFNTLCEFEEHLGEFYKIDNKFLNEQTGIFDLEEPVLKPLCLPQIVEKRNFDLPCEVKLYPNGDDQDVNTYQIRHTYGKGTFVTEPKNLSNLLNLLSPKETDKQIMFLDNNWVLFFYCFVLGFLKLMISFTIGHYLFDELIEFKNCIPFSLGVAGCPATNYDMVFITVLVLAEVMVSVFMIYDLTQSGTALIGNQTYQERTKYSTLLEYSNFRGRFGLTAFRLLMFFIVIISSYYKADGTRDEWLDYQDLLEYPFTDVVMAGSVTEAFKALASEKMLLWYVFILAWLSFISMCIHHPWFQTTDLSKNKEGKVHDSDFGILSKTATFVLTCNTIAYCFFISLVMKLLFDLLTLAGDKNYSFDWKKSQLYITTIVIMFFVSWKYVRATLTRRSSYNVPVFFFVYLPFYLYFAAFCGLENIRNELMKKIIAISVLSVFIVNVLYWLTYPLRDLRKIMFYFTQTVTTSRKLALILTVTFCILFYFALRYLSEAFSNLWFEFEYNYCCDSPSPNFLPMLEHIPKLTHTPANQTIDDPNVNIMRIFMIVPVVSVILFICYGIFDRKFLGFRKTHFWLAFYICALNITNVMGLYYIEDVLENLSFNGFVEISFPENALDSAKGCSFLIIIAAAIDMFTCAYIIAGINKQYEPFENPVFVPMNKNKMKIVNIDNAELVKDQISLSDEKDEDPSPSMLPFLVYIAIYAIVVFSFTYFALQNDWVVLYSNDYLPRTIQNPLGSNQMCPLSIDEVPDMVDTMVSVLSYTGNTFVKSATLVTTEDKLLVLMGLAMSPIVAIVSFSVYAVAPSFLNPYLVMAGYTTFVLPSVMYLTFTPTLLESAISPMIMDVSVEPGMFCAIAIFFVFLVFMSLVIAEIMPLSALQVTSSSLKMATVEKSAKKDQ